MAPINISAITFIPGMEFTFGSFNFIPASTEGCMSLIRRQLG